MKPIAIIPARGGSKRVPRKNVRLFHGKPMLAWSIQAAQNSKLFSDVIVSTDDAEISDIARSFGARVPFVRPPNLSNDSATTVAVMGHAVQWLDANELPSEQLCCIYATAPFLTSADLKRGFEALESSQADYVYAVTEFDYSPYRGLETKQTGFLGLQHQHLSLTRSQDLPDLVHDAGLFYWARTATWRCELDILGSNGLGIPIPKTRAQDIDTEEDWALAAALFSLSKNTPCS